MTTLDTPKELLRQLMVQDHTTIQSIDKVEMQLVAYHPVPRWQCNVKFRDATAPWATWVDNDPALAMSKALDIALRGPEVAARESVAMFYEKKPLADGMMELMLMEYEDQIAAAKVEFAPYRGWVVVLFPKKGADLSFLGDRVEIRSGDFVPSASPAPVRTSSGATAAKLSAGQPVVIPAGGRMTVTKDVLDNEYKSKMGKFPDRNIKKADLAKLLDELEATGK